MYGRVERALFCDLHVRRLPLNDLKAAYQPRFGITARQFNSVRTFLDGKVRAVREGLTLRLANLREKVKSTEKNVAELTKKLAQLHKNRKSIEPGSAHKLRFKLHHKKRRLHLLRTKLSRLETEAARSVPRLTFGSNKLFRAQFHRKENGFSSHAEWKAAWKAARSSQFVCVGSKDETGGNQSCTYFSADDTLRLRLPSDLIVEGDDKYLSIPDVAFQYGNDVIRAALCVEGGQALTYRFIRRSAKTRTGHATNEYEWFVQVTTERVAVAKTTDRRLGAIGLDLNPALIAMATLDRYGNPVSTEHFPVQLHKRSSGQIEATLADVIADIVLQAHSQHLPIVIERLDFTR